MRARDSAEAILDTLKTATYFVAALFFLAVPLATVYGLFWLIHLLWRRY